MQWALWSGVLRENATGAHDITYTIHYEKSFCCDKERTIFKGAWNHGITYSLVGCIVSSSKITTSPTGFGGRVDLFFFYVYFLFLFFCLLPLAAIYLFPYSFFKAQRWVIFSFQNYFYAPLDIKWCAPNDPRCRLRWIKIISSDWLGLSRML